MDPDALPQAIVMYQRAHDQRDVEPALATFSPDATVADDGASYTGTEQIRGWLANAAKEFTFTRTLTRVDDLGDSVFLVHNHLSGNFPGNEIDLKYRFELRDGLIYHLDIAPC